ncbi:uncharacterized protein V1510DRAFT_416606 [Dipodascopsis tothii]|uniref:uncharacterized protein n=1 Tax=Dipodascopsis tothii TaxID=44089 RepID=UPI0034CEC901
MEKQSPTKLTRFFRSLRLSQLPRFYRLVVIPLVIFTAVVVVLRASARRPSTIDLLGGPLAGDLEPSFLETAERRCPAHLAGQTRRIVTSASNPFMTMMRINFMADGALPRFNPSILPLPASADHPYLGFASQVRGSNYELWACELSFGVKKISKRMSMQCATDPVHIPIPITSSSQCLDHHYLALRAGPQVPRAFFSPDGAPLLMYSGNSADDCIGQFVVDLRMYYPNLVQLFPDPPIIYSQPVELRRPGVKQEFEQNWVLMFEHNKTFIHQDLLPRSFSSVGWQTKNLAPKTFNCLASLTANKQAVLHQSTNTLRLSLCEFPCTPTEENTVLVSIVHVKFQEGLHTYFEKRALVTKATFPFDVLGVSPPLHFAGTDEQDLVYAVSLAWDSRSEPRKSRPNVYDFRRSHYVVEPPAEDGAPAEAAAEPEPEPEHKDEPQDEPKQKQDRRVRRAPKKPTPLELREKLYNRNKVLDYTTENRQLDGFESDYYHGYLNDVILIGFGIEDKESAVIDVRASSLVECLKKCNN